MKFRKDDILISIGDGFFWFIHILNHENKDGCYSDIIGFSAGDITTNYNGHSKLNLPKNYLLNPSVEEYKILINMLFS